MFDPSNHLSTLTKIALALIAITAPVSATQSDTCPDERATSVHADFRFSPSYKICGIGFEIFGYGGGIIGEKCHDFVVLVPAHQKCFGKPSTGNRCVPDAALIVKYKECDCAGLVIPWIEIGVPTDCRCSDWKDGGQVEDFKTVTCD